jgi:hypothetical protein
MDVKEMRCEVWVGFKWLKTGQVVFVHEQGNKH